MDHWPYECVEERAGHCRDGEAEREQREHDDYMPIAHVPVRD